MSKNLEISLLLDFYGKMLTDKQREVVELYYNEDLSLSEIADHCGITRQGVRDSIKRGELVLMDLEERLGLSKRFLTIQTGLDRIVDQARQIIEYNNRYHHTLELSQKANDIINIATGLND